MCVCVCVCVCVYEHHTFMMLLVASEKNECVCT